MREGPVSAASSSYHFVPIGRAFRWTSTDAKLDAAMRLGGAAACERANDTGETTTRARTIAEVARMRTPGCGCAPRNSGRPTIATESTTPGPGARFPRHPLTRLA